MFETSVFPVDGKSILLLSSMNYLDRWTRRVINVDDNKRESDRLTSRRINGIAQTIK